MTNITIIAGTFNDEGGKKSGWANKFSHELYKRCYPALARENIHNGGTWDELVRMCDTLPDTGIVLWLADVPNDKPKLIKQIKERHPKLFLVTSKRNLNGEYSLQNLVSRALNVKANLLLEIGGSREKIQTTILDPLGNVFAAKEANLGVLAEVLLERLNVLINIKRVYSKQVGDAIAVPNYPEITKFLDIVKTQADVFHTIIHGVDTTRMLGNASFRCARGFPSFLNDGQVFVSQRNVDKRFIGPEAFVAVQSGKDGVEYFGPNKPSVDTPVQLCLFKAYPNIRFMLHSHTYIVGAPFTQDVLPCGAIEEVKQIMDAVPYYNANNFCVNIKGHGFICLASSLDYFQFVQWIARPSPEICQ